MDDSRAEHWDEVYRTRDVTDVSWFQPEPSTSIEIVESLDARPASVVDVGAGASLLVDRLLDAGLTDLAVLDVSAEALDRVRDRLGERAREVTFIAADLLTWEPERQWELWHDRAVFHFLVEPPDQERYVATAAAAVPRGGHVVIAAFAPDGPERCSGLPAARHDGDSIAARFAPAFALESSARVVHVTPSGVEQPFTWAVLRRR